MAYKRRNRKRRFRKFRKTYRKRYNKNNRVSLIKRTYVEDSDLVDASFTAIPSEDATPRYNDFRLDQLPNYTDITNLYDEYKICGIKRKYVLDANASELNSGVRPLVNLITVKDYNTTTVLGSETEALEYGTFKMNRLDKTTTRYFVPAVLISGTYGTFKKRWIDTAKPDATHMGLREAVTSSSNTEALALGNLKIYTTFYIAVKNTK